MADETPDSEDPATPAQTSNERTGAQPSDEPGAQPSDEPGAQPSDATGTPVEHYGIVSVSRHRKDDGRMLLLYTREEREG